ncbi:MAG: hypothetical protein HY585_05470 [Candidatus Omnitrophica bacterium]|nr:hypothetical protein [Candidatus Omnitrophota bacterium]
MSVEKTLHYQNRIIVFLALILALAAAVSYLKKKSDHFYYVEFIRYPESEASRR